MSNRFVVLSSEHAAGPAAPLALPGQGEVGILTGGISQERGPSLASGEAAEASLRRQGYSVSVIDTASPTLAQELSGVDVAFLAIAGQYGEDGKLQGLLEMLGLPYTGSGVLASAVAMSKPAAKTMVSAAGVPVLPGAEVDLEADPVVQAHALRERFGTPLMVKAISEGSSIDSHLAQDVQGLAAALAEVQYKGCASLAEPFCEGMSVTVGVLELEDGPVALPPLEIRTPNTYFDWSAKQTAGLRSFHCPAELPDGELERLRELALLAHTTLGCSGYSRSDFIMSADGPVWLELNTLPSLKETATLATMAGVVGIDHDGLLRHILAAALRRTGYRP